MSRELGRDHLRGLERRHDLLSARAAALVRDHAAARRGLLGARRFLDLAPLAAGTLEDLATALFGEILDQVEANLTHAIREILGQDRVVTSQREVKGNRLQVYFQIFNQGREEQVEDIYAGQGGSVCNILSVGLRLIALSQLDPARHRPFLVLDEQDCWLKPSLVPRFMKLIAEIAERLGLQVLVISHHPLDLFAVSAKRVYALEPSREHGALVKTLK